MFLADTFILEELEDIDRLFSADTPGKYVATPDKDTVTSGAAVG